MYLQCPYCSAIWGMEEIDEQYCGACGYPDPDDGDLLLTDEFDYYDYTDECDRDW